MIKGMCFELGVTAKQAGFTETEMPKAWLNVSLRRCIQEQNLVMQACVLNYLGCWGRASLDKLVTSPPPTTYIQSLGM